MGRKKIGNYGNKIQLRARFNIPICIEIFLAVQCGAFEWKRFFCYANQVKSCLRIHVRCYCNLLPLKPPIWDLIASCTAIKSNSSAFKHLATSKDRFAIPICGVQNHLSAALGVAGLKHVFSPPWSLSFRLWTFMLMAGEREGDKSTAVTANAA